MRSTRKSRQGTAAHREKLGEFADKARGVRLQKALADAGVAARRECEALVVEGAVTVNGKTVDTLPAWVDPRTDRIEVFGRPIRKPEKHVYIALFKPRGTVCTNSDPEGRPRAIDLVQHPDKPRLYCVGRLDLDSSGLLILTNDGEFANRLTHPRFGVRKGYDLVLDGSVDELALARIEREIFAADKPSNPRAGMRGIRSSLSLVKRERDKTAVHLELAEHRNLQIRPLMVELGHPVKKMRRTSFGPLKLKGLAVGEWRELTPREVNQLLRASRGEDAGEALEPKAPRRTMTELAEARAERIARLAEEATQAPAAEASSPRAGKPASTRTPDARATREGRGGVRVPGVARGREGDGRPDPRGASRGAERGIRPSSARTPARGENRGFRSEPGGGAGPGSMRGPTRGATGGSMRGTGGRTERGLAGPNDRDSRRGTTRGADHRLSGGPGREPSRGPSRGPSRQPSREPSRGPNRGPNRGPDRAPTRGPNATPSRGAAGGPSRSSGTTRGPSTGRGSKRAPTKDSRGPARAARRGRGVRRG